MKNLKITLIAFLFMWAGISGASAAPFLEESALNIDVPSAERPSAVQGSEQFK